MRVCDSNLQIDPESILVFTRNQYQTVSNIKISLANCGPSQKYAFELKTTNKVRYQVSESRGEFSKASSPYLINIFIRSTSSLEDCLRDKFELKVFMVKGTLTLVTMRKYKVFIEHVRDKSTFKDSPTNDAISKSATSHYTSVVKMPNTPLASVVKYTLMPKTARENLPQKQQQDVLKKQLDTTLKWVQQKRIKFALMSKEVHQNRARKRFRAYLLVFLVLMWFAIGWAFCTFFLKPLQLGNLLQDLLADLTLWPNTTHIRPQPQLQ